VPGPGGGGVHPVPGPLPLDPRRCDPPPARLVGFPRALRLTKEECFGLAGVLWEAAGVLERCSAHEAAALAGRLDRWSRWLEHRLCVEARWTGDEPRRPGGEPDQSAGLGSKDKERELTQ